MAKFAKKILSSMAVRTTDTWGSGEFGASRGSRMHKGVDIISRAGENVYSPISATVVREAIPYANDSRYSGLLLRGTDEWRGYELKIFYIEGFSSGSVKAGDKIGEAQDLTLKFPGITNHLHLELRKNGVVVDPFELWQNCK